MFPFLTIATLILSALTVLPLWQHPHWTVRSLDFPRLQLAVCAALLIGMQLVFLEYENAGTWALVLAASLCLVWHLRRILPYTPLWPSEVVSCKSQFNGPCLSIITANVLTPNRHSEKLIALVKDYRPDVLVTLESDAWWQDRLDALAPEMPHAIKHPLDNLYGMHVYSRLPLHDQRVSFLVEEDVPSMHALIRLDSGDLVQMHFLHPAPPSPTENPESSERDAELVIVARSVAESSRPIVVTGDLNDVAWSSTTRLFKKISGLLDPRLGRGMFNTFHAGCPMLRWPLDHVFHSPHFTVRAVRRLPHIGSDHFPLYTQLCLTPSRAAEQERSEKDSPPDMSRARSIAGRQGVGKGDVPDLDA